MTKRKSWIALLGILLLFAACKGETPTAPPSGSQNPPGGTPPAGANLVLTASNTTPIIDSTVTITATVTQNGQNVPNGTAVEFSTTAGTFTDVTPGVTSIIRTTTDGVATVHLTASTAGLARVTATVNNVTRSVDVTFRTTPACVPPDPRCPVATTPTITSVTPAVGKPQGGETIRINGTNFIPPLRVLFDLGTGTPVEAIIVNSGTNFIDVLTPAVNLGAGQQLVADIIVITKVGSATEERVVGNDVFTFRNVSLTPVIHSLSPTSGPINGGTRITIFGEGFQPPVQVFFGTAEAQVLNTTFDQIIVLSPDARSTNPDGSGAVLGPVEVRVVNILSNTRGTSPESFNYKAKMQITAFHPQSGPAAGGTDVTIDGVGFDPPVTVFIAGVEAQVISAVGTRIVARTRPTPNSCSGAADVVAVTNQDNGDNATSAALIAGQTFTYIGINPTITSVVDNSTGTVGIRPGESVIATVSNPGVGPLGTATVRFGVNDRSIIPNPSTVSNAATPVPFTFSLPTTGFTFPSTACTTSVANGSLPGTRLGDLDVPITFTNSTTGCTDTTTITVTPLDPNPCLTPPRPSVTAPAGGTCLTPAASIAGAPSTANGTITVANANEAQPLNITSVTISGPDAAQFTVQPTTFSGIAAGGTTNFTLTFDPTGAAGPRNATVTLNTNSPTAPTLTVCVQATANP
ncbi:MAG TPA: IPT/TIG domain-containing protein [Vicinamibacterales bacterium]